ncbi:MAG: APC family permease [Eubacteriales bacterium]
MKKNDYRLSFFETLTMAAGFAIGAGIITQTGIAIGMTGRSVFLAFPVSAILFLIAFRPIFIMSTILPKTSASYFYSKKLIGEEIGGFYTYIFFLGRMTIAIFGISVVQYAASIIPALHDPILSKFVAIMVLTLFFFVNLNGMKSAAIFQNIMFFVLTVGLICFVILGMGKVQSGFFNMESFMTNGFNGFYTAVSLLFFAVAGAYIIVDFAPSIKNSSKVVVKVIFIVTVSIALIYSMLGIVASGVLPVSRAMGKPLTVAAEIVFVSKGFFSFFVICVCIGSLLTTLNSSFLWYSNSLVNACNDGWLPKSLMVKNKKDVPYRLMIIFYLFGLIPTLLGINLNVLSKMAIGLTIISSCIPMAGILNLPKKYPNEWAASKYAKRYPIWRIRGMVCITYIIMGSQVYALFKGNPPVANILILTYVAIVVTYLTSHYIKRKQKSVRYEMIER